MKVPDKIWVHELSAKELNIPFKEYHVEYTRTDAFIEKAASWIENNLSKYSELTDKDEYGNKLKEPEMNVFYGQAVKDFINYMKGE